MNYFLRSTAQLFRGRQHYYNPNTVGDFKIRLDNIYLFTYFDEVNPTDIFDVTTFDTKTLKLKNVEGDMWKRFEKYLNDGEYGESRIEGRENKSGLLPGIAVATAVLIMVGGVCFYKKGELSNKMVYITSNRMNRVF